MDEKTSTKPPHLKDGSEWAEHEDCIVGDEQGLRNLVSACHVALESGEYYGRDLGDYVGVKKLESKWFTSPEKPAQSRLAKFALSVFSVLAAVLAVVGAVTVVLWVIWMLD